MRQRDISRLLRAVHRAHPPEPAPVVVPRVVGPQPHTVDEKYLEPFGYYNVCGYIVDDCAGLPTRDDLRLTVPAPGLRFTVPILDARFVVRPRVTGYAVRPLDARYEVRPRGTRYVVSIKKGER